MNFVGKSYEIRHTYSWKYNGKVKDIPYNNMAVEIVNIGSQGNRVTAEIWGKSIYLVSV